MTSSAQMKSVERMAEVYDAKLRADDPRFQRSVFIDHEDGSRIFYRFAFVMQYEDYWLVFTEHHGKHVYHREDAYVWELNETASFEEFKPELGK